MVHGIEVEFLRFEASALHGARLENPEVDAAVKKFQSAFLDEFNRLDRDCFVM